MSQVSSSVALPRLALATLVAAVVTFGLGALFFAGVGASFYQGAFGHLLRPAATAPVWALVLEKLVQAGLMTALYAIVRRWGGARVTGTRFGAAIALLTGLPWALSMWANYPLSFAAVALVALVDMTRTVIAGAVIRRVLGTGPARAPALARA